MLSKLFKWILCTFPFVGISMKYFPRAGCPNKHGNEVTMSFLQWQYEVNPLFSSISKTLKGWIFPPEKLTEILINLTIFPFIINNNIIVQMFDISVNVNDPKKGDNIWKVHESYNIIGTPCRSIQGVLGLFLGV